MHTPGTPLCPRSPRINVARHAAKNGSAADPRDSHDFKTDKAANSGQPGPLKLSNAYRGLHVSLFTHNANPILSRISADNFPMGYIFLFADTRDRSNLG